MTKHVDETQVQADRILAWWMICPIAAAGLAGGMLASAPAIFLMLGALVTLGWCVYVVDRHGPSRRRAIDRAARKDAISQ